MVDDDLPPVDKAIMELEGSGGKGFEISGNVSSSTLFLVAGTSLSSLSQDPSL